MKPVRAPERIWRSRRAAPIWRKYPDVEDTHSAAWLCPAWTRGGARPHVVSAQDPFSRPAPRSPSWRVCAVQLASLFPESSATIRHNSEPPTCRVVSSQTGNGLPERNTEAMDASSGVRDFRYSATMAVFSSFLVVAAMRSQASASLIMLFVGASIPLVRPWFGLFQFS